MNYTFINLFLKLLEKYKNKMTPQQMKTLKGQALSGDVFGAQRGLERLLRN